MPPRYRVTKPGQDTIYTAVGSLLQVQCYRRQFGEVAPLAEHSDIFRIVFSHDYDCVMLYDAEGAIRANIWTRRIASLEIRSMY